MQGALHKHLTRLFLQSALPPVLVAVAIAMAVFFAMQGYVQQQTAELHRGEIEARLRELAELEAQLLDERLGEVASKARLLRTQQQYILQHETCFDREKHRPVLRTAANGFTYKAVDNGGGSLVFSTPRPITDAQRQRAGLTEYFDPIMKSVLESDEEIVLVYYNQPDNLTRIHPYMADFHTKLTAEMDIASAPIYYIADEENNPTRVHRWSDVYLDHIGLGWIVTCAIPVYVEEELRGVTGIDLRVEPFVRSINELPPHSGGLLLDRKHNIIAASRELEERFGLRGLRARLEPGTISEEFIFPDEFNLRKTPNQAVARQMSSILTDPEAVRSFRLLEKDYLIAQHPVPETGWTLMLFGDEATLMQPLRDLQREARWAGVMAGVPLGLLGVLLVLALGWRSLGFARRMGQPIQALREAAERMSTTERIEPVTPEPSGVTEIDELGARFATMAGELAKHRAGLEQEVRTRTEELHLANEQLRAALTRQQEAQEALVRSERMAAVGMLAGGVAHEFNNVHQIICAWSHIALEETPGSPKIQEALGRILRASGRGSAIAENLLAFARGRPGTRGPITLPDLVRDVLAVVQGDMASQGIVVTDAMDAMPATVMDGAQIAQVVLNLLINAQHALLGQPKKELTLETETEAEWVRLLVRDSGCGVPPAERERIFEPFYSTKGEHAEGPTPQSRVRGTGLGLSVSRRIVEEHGGRLEVRETQGPGACFALTLPRLQQPPVEPPAPKPEAASLAGKRILVVDDEEDITALCELSLLKAGATVATAASGVEARDALLAERFDLVLLDLQMPCGGGEWLIDEIEALAAPRPVVAIMTGRLPKDVERTGVQRRVAAVISKPFSPLDLQRLLAALLA